MSTRLLNQITQVPFSDRTARVTNTVAGDGENILAKTSVAPLIIKAPAAPTDNATFCVTDADANASTNNITVSGNGNLIDGSANYTIDTDGAVQEFLFDRGQWRKIDESRAVEARPGVRVSLQGPRSASAVVSVGATAPITSSGGAAPTIGISAATPSAAGSMSAADKTKLNALPATPVTAVSGAAPVTSTGGATPQIGITAATTVAAGSLSAADKTKLDGLQPQGASTIIGSATPNVDWSASGTYEVTLVAATPGVMSFSNTADGRVVIVKVIGNAAASFALPAGIQWAGGTVPTPTLNGVDVYTFVRIGAIITGSCLTDTH